MKDLNLNEERQKILKEREEQYGSFKSNMESLSLFYSCIKICLGRSNSSLLVADFVRYMLALKTSRSLKCKDKPKVYKDCIVDFINYAELFFETYGGSIELNERIFNPILCNSFKDSRIPSLNKINSIVNEETPNVCD